MPKNLLVRRRHFPYGDAVFLSLPKSSGSASDSSCSPSYYQPSPQSDERSHSPTDEPQVLDLRICTINAAIASAKQSITSKLVPQLSQLNNNNNNSNIINNNSHKVSPFAISNRTDRSNGSTDGKRKKSKSSHFSKGASSEHKRIRSLVRPKSDQTKNSPVSGTVILGSDDEDDAIRFGHAVRRNGDIDPSLNLVIVSEEARAELAKINNIIGDYNCCLCHQKFADAFGLAQHSCPRIVHLEYRCPDCEKVFNCPANLASHRRWHKPRST